MKRSFSLGSFFALASLFIIALNGSRLMDPPYWDALTGVYTQGVWLYRNHFDYRMLAQLPQFNQGGPNVHLFYFFAPLFAALLHLFQPRVVFLILHLLIMTCAAGGLTIFFSILSTIVPAWLAGLWVLAAASNPIWFGQTASLYLEIPLAAMIALSIYAVWRGRYGWATVACMASYFMKSSALLYALAGAVYGCFLAVRQSSRRSLLLILPFVAMLLLSHWAPSPSSFFWDFAGYTLYFFQKAKFQFPLLACEFILAAVLGLYSLWSVIVQKKQMEHASFMVFLAIYSFGFWLSFIIETMPLPRYSVMVVLPLTALLAFLTRERMRGSAALALLLVIGGIATQSGRLLPAIPAYRGGRSGQEVERSREYLRDLDGNRALCTFLESNYFNSPLVTKSPFTQMLTIPELGYVTHALPYVIEAGRPSAVSHAAPLEWFLKRRGMHETLCLYSPNKDEFSFGPSLRPIASERVLIEDSRLPAVNVLYVRDWDKRPPTAPAQ
jgi:hypothetical protein